MGHAFLAPSGAFMWGPGRCHAYPSLRVQFPDSSGKEALEGDAAHHLAHETILGRGVVIGECHENGELYSAEMLAEAAEYIADCREVIDRATNTAGAVWYVETKVFAHNWISPLCDGTPDFFAVFPEQRRVVLKDFKFGHGYVSAFRNYQLIVYLIAIFESLQLGHPDDSWHIEAAIYQPRNFHPEGHVRFWRPKGSEIFGWIEEFRAAALTATQEAFCRVGDWCRYCEVAAACVTHQEASSYAMATVGAPRVHHPDPDSLGRELSAVTDAYLILKIRKDALEEEALGAVAQAKRVTGWRGGYRNGRKKWTVAADRVIAWCAVLGADVRKQDVITPKQAEKLGITPELVDSITIVPSTYVLERVTPNSLAKGLSENGE